MLKDTILLPITQHKLSHERFAPCNMEESSNINLTASFGLVSFSVLTFFSDFLTNLFRFTVFHQDLSPTRAIICSYTVQAMAAIMVLLSSRGTAPLKKPCAPYSK